MRTYIIIIIIFCVNFTFASQNWLLENSIYSLEEKEELYNETRKIYRKCSKETELLYLEKTATYLDKRIKLYGLYNIAEANFVKNKLEVAEEYIKQLKTFKDPVWKSTAAHLAKFLEGKILVAKNNYPEGTNIHLQLIQDATVSPYVHCIAYAELGYISRLNKDTSFITFYYNKAIQQAAALDNLYLGLKSELDLFSCLNSLNIKSKGTDWSNQKGTYLWEIRALASVQSSYFIRNAADNFEKENYDTAIAFYLKAIAFNKKNYPKGSVDMEYLGIAEAYYYKKEYKTALVYVNRLLENEAYSNLLEHISDHMSGMLSKFISLKVKIHRALKDYEQVDYYQEILILKQKESFDKAKQENLAKYNKEFETAEKEKLIHEQDLLIAHQHRKNQLYIFLFAFSTLLLTGLFYNYKQNQKLASKEQEFSQKAIALERAQNMELQKLDDYRSHLFASLSHEFKTPLTLLKTPLEQMHQETFKGDYSYYYGLMLRNTNRLLELVNQMLTLSRLKHGKVNANLQQLNVKQVIHNVFIQFEGIAIKKGLKLELYGPLKSISFDMDEDFLNKILGNLIQNAIKYTERGGTVFVQSSTTNTHFKLTVKDTGEGIDKENLEHIFEAFYREKSYQLEQKDGVGLGLSIVKGLTDLLNGKIDIQSQKNVGTTISIYLPIAPNNKDILNQDFLAYPIKTIHSSFLDQNEERLSPASIERLQEDSNKPILLVVEDNADLQYLINDQLVNDFQIVSAFNGLEALNVLQTIHPKLILSDIMMDKMDGIQFVKKVQANIKLSHIPILLLSALDAEEAEREGLEAGAIDFLSKPVNFENLRLQLHNLLKIQRQKQEDISDYIISDGATKKVSNIVTIDQQFILDLKKIISENIHAENFTVEVLSEKMYISRNTLFVKVKNLTGISVSSFIRKFRLAKAKTFLEHEQGNVSDAAYAVGIYNLSYFSRIFRDEFGMSPRNYLNERQRQKQTK